VTAGRSFAPLWLMGLTNAVFGMYGGIVLIALPQLLSLRHVPESTIATMTAVMASPGFWTFLVSPVLDVRFSRRGYAVATAMAAAVLMIGALVNLDHLAWVEGLLVAGYFCATLYQSALGGWLSSITKAEQASSLSVWMTIGNIAGGGLMAVTASEVMRLLPLAVAAGVLGVMVVLPTAVFVWMRAPGPDRRLAKESFSQFFGEVMSLLKRREVLIAILIFVAPAATFSLTNFLSGLGEDFHASPHFVAVVAGLGVMLGGIVGCRTRPRPSRWRSLVRTCFSRSRSRPRWRSPSTRSGAATRLRRLLIVW